MEEFTPFMQLAYDYVESTNAVVFLTGKAGTGKTTFLQNLRQTSKKKLAVVAPTGVAAINAGGMTIHSFFQLPFGPLIPRRRGTAVSALQYGKKGVAVCFGSACFDGGGRREPSGLVSVRTDSEQDSYFQESLT
jgi:hypothetical protein